MTVVAEPIAEIDPIVAEEQRRHPIPGVSIGIVSGGEETLAAYGVTSVDHPLPVTSDTLFQIGSITKTFLGTLVMRLVEDGRLDLDAPVRRWVPELRLRDEDAAARATLRHLLTHRAGWFGDHFEPFGDDSDALARYVASMAELEQQVPLGTEWAYNNAAFALAGRVVEVVVERPIEQAMRELVFVPLGLARTFFFAHEVITYRVAAGHNVFRDPGGAEAEARVARPWAIPRASNCVGGIVSSVPDLLRYARFHMGDGTTADGEPYLSPGSMELMRSPLVPAALGQHRGIAWSVAEEGGVRVIGHGGATIGQQALLSIAPERRAAIAMLTNSNEATQLQNAVSRWWSRRYLGVEQPPPAPIEHAPGESEHVGHDAAHCPLVLFAQLLLTGTYRNPANELRIAMDDRGLVVHRRLFGSLRKQMEEPPPQPEPARAAMCAGDRILLLDGPLAGTQIELLGDGSRPVEWIRFQSRLYRKDAEAATAS